MDYEIITGVQRPDGILVLWQVHQEIRSMFFTFTDLIRLKVNALDLIQHPKKYRLDPELHTISMTR